MTKPTKPTTDAPLAILNLHNPGQAALPRSSTVAWGVPLSRGAVSDPATLRLFTTDGRRLPTQADAQARWADGSISWAFLTAETGALDPGAEAPLTLRAGSPTRRAPSAIRRTRTGWQVTLGPVRLKIPKQGPPIRDIARRVHGVWRPLVRSVDLRATLRREALDTEFLASRSAERTVTVEREGALRVVIAIRGIHTAGDGREFGPYVLRLELRRAEAAVRLTHSLVFDADPETDRLAACDIDVQVACDPCHATRAGGQSGAEVVMERQRADFTPDYRYSRLLQDSPTHFCIERWVDRRRSAIFTARGLQSDGWFELAGTGGRVALAVRDVWQNHPKTLEADAATGLLRAGLYPACAEPLNLSRYSDRIYSWTYEHPVFQTEKWFPFPLEAGARGIRKTHDLLLMLDEPNPSATTERFNRPPRLTWSPEHTERTRVIEPFSSRLPDAWVRQAAEWIEFLDSQLTAGGTGYCNYFDLPGSFDNAAGRWFHDYGGWGYINEEALPSLGFWHAYLMTGNPTALRLAQAMSRHTADIDCRHAGPKAGLGSRHNVNHWGDSCFELRISQPFPRRFAYLMNDERGIADLARVTLDHFARRFREPFDLNAHCCTPAVVATLLFAQQTGLDDTRAWLVALADAWAQSVESNGQMAGRVRIDATRRTAEPLSVERRRAEPLNWMMFACFGGSQVLAELAEYLDHNALRQSLVRMAHYVALPVATRTRLDGPGAQVLSDLTLRGRLLDLLGYAHRVSGDNDLVRVARSTLQHFPYLVRIEQRPAPRYGVAGAAVTPALVVPPPSDQTAAIRRLVKRNYALFEPGESSQFFCIALHLHKLPGIAWFCR